MPRITALRPAAGDRMENSRAAIALAKQVPAPFGGVEVRPVMVFD